MTVYVPRDPAKLVKDFLQSRIPGSVTFALNVPSEWAPTSGTHVAVFDDSGPGVWPVMTEPQIRITVWSSGRSECRRVAGLCQGTLLAVDVPGIAKVREGTNIVDALDSQNGGRMASFTVRCRTRLTAA